jgi:hypothetical protein
LDVEKQRGIWLNAVDWDGVNPIIPAFATALMMQIPVGSEKSADFRYFSRIIQPDFRAGAG